MKKGMEWLFQKLYDAGWRYIVADNYDNIYLTNEKPVMFDDVDEVRISSCEKRIGATRFIKILPKLKPNEVFSIEEELGIVDWSKVKVDTPILVSQNKVDWKPRYFARYTNGIVETWLCGCTSWSIDSANDTCIWKYAKLVGDSDE